MESLPHRHTFIATHRWYVALAFRRYWLTLHYLENARTNSFEFFCFILLLSYTWVVSGRSFEPPTVQLNTQTFNGSPKSSRGKIAEALSACSSGALKQRFGVQHQRLVFDKDRGRSRFWGCFTKAKSGKFSLIHSASPFRYMLRCFGMAVSCNCCSLGDSVLTCTASL